MFDTDPDQMELRLSQWAQGFADQADRFHRMRAQVEQIRVTDSSPDGAVRVTVDSSGALTDLALTDKIYGMPPPEVAAQVMACLRRAQQQLAPLVQETMQATIGGEHLLVDNVVSGYRERFGADLSPRRTGPDAGVLGLGVLDDDGPPRRQPQPPWRHRPPRDEEYFADRDYLR